MNKEEFCQRFIDRMVRTAGFDTFDCGTPVRDYAEEMAPTYWEEQHQKDGEGPEDCADADMSYWGED